MKNKSENLHLSLQKKDIWYKEYNLLLLSQVYISDYKNGVFSLFTFTNVVKKLSLENVFKFFHFKLNRKKIWNSKGVQQQYDYLFVKEVNNNPSIETLQCVQKSFTGKSMCELISDNRLHSDSILQINIFQYLNLYVLFKTLIDVIQEIPVLIKNRKDLKDVSSVYKVHPFWLIGNCFDSILLINIVESYFSKVSVKKIIFVSDVHKLSRIITIYAKRNNISTFVLQHGATVGDEGYLPILSDKMLVWGTLSKKWFIEREQDSDKIVIVGSPRMDNIRYSLPEKDITKGIQSVLIVMSEMRYEKKFLELIRDAFVKLGIPDIEMRIKLHPTGADNYKHIVKDIFEDSGLSYHIYGIYDIRKLLQESDMVFVTTSSVGMEAMIFNKPIIQFQHEGFNYIRMSYEDFDCSHAFKNSDDIINILSNSNLLFSKLVNYPVFVENYFYSLDGNSSIRAKDYIEKYPN